MAVRPRDLAAIPIKTLLIANRGEIAIRIARTAAEMGIRTVAIYSPDDEKNLHVQRMDEAIALPQTGPRAYLDQSAIVAAAKKTGADAIHPGYGFLAEQAEFAQRVEDAGFIFIGPTPQSLSLFGDKLAAKQRARSLNVPIIEGTTSATSLAEAETFFSRLSPGAAVVIKAVAGGGGRGMRVVQTQEELAGAYERCCSEAEAAFGNSAVYVEHYLPQARHVEVQIIGDGLASCIAIGERECTLQRRHQKLVEVAPSPALNNAVRAQLSTYALALANSDRYRSLATFEFLINANDPRQVFFIEANPRIQVEHTVTEAVYGLDLVQCQLRIAAGASLAEILPEPETLQPQGYAMQVRVNMERMDKDAKAAPTSGELRVYEVPTGAGVRVDGFAYAGYHSSARFDSLLAKVIVHSRHDDFVRVVNKAARALREFRIEGIDTNLPWLCGLLSLPAVKENQITTNFIAQHAASIAEAAREHATFAITAQQNTHTHARKRNVALAEGSIAVVAPMQATVQSFSVAEGDSVAHGQEVAILEAMKMEHVIHAPCTGTIQRILTQRGETLMEGEAILALEPGDANSEQRHQSSEVDLEHRRDDLQEVEQRRAFGLDENRPDAVAKRHARGQQTARENLAQVCDPGTFIEYGEFAVAAQSQRRSMEDLIRNTSGDGILTGLGQVNGHLFSEDRARCAFAIGDYMVLAGTQGQRHHRKLDRILCIAKDWQLPLIFFAEGGGGRPGDTDRATYAGISNETFTKFAQLSGQVPLVGVVSGRCFAGNAAFLGCCDVIIADDSSNIGMAGPAMIEGGGLGIYPPEAIGPIDSQCQNGVVDVRVRNEKEACAVAKQYLAYFQGPLAEWQASDQRRLRHVVPENRLRVYEVRQAINTMADADSVLELRREFGVGIVTALIRIEGKPFGVMANNSKHLGGAIDADAADKAARFMQLCDAFEIPLISLCDCPGFMVGPEAEKTALVRHVCRMYVTARSISVPMFGVVLRKCYGLGAMAMLGGGTYDNFFTVSWPTGEFGPMGLEGAVKLGYRRELDALTDPQEKQALYAKLLNDMYQQGKGIAVANTLEIDAVIDPIETRKWILSGLRSCKLREPLAGRKRPFVDTW